ncbi:hypothetical protein KFU94_12425 [Chloroflexi bacterium TSY]|nr:hypothetical protein [Chloroflexi bacterium TSY]
MAHLNHRLVRMSLRLLRAEVWHARHGLTRNGSRAHEQAGDSLTDNNSSSSTGSEHIDSGHQGLYRVTARVAPDHLLGELAVVAHARLVITGGDSQRLHEEIITAGGEIRRGVFRRFDSLTKMDAALAAATNEMPARGAGQIAYPLA